MKWHKTCKELPKYGGRYLVCTIQNEVKEARYSVIERKFSVVERYIFEDKYQKVNVATTYWAKLPKPPKED